MASIAERESLAFFKTLPVKVDPTQSFLPLAIEHYLDGAGTKQRGKPDALFTQPRTFTFIECKDGKLNSHPDMASCHWALQSEFARRTRDGTDKTYSFLTEHFNRTDKAFMLANTWNNSLFKVLALQALHGWEKYVVCFKGNRPAAEARYYAEHGLVFCTNASVNSMLATIELAAHGVYFPFRLHAPRCGYTIDVNTSPNPEHAGFTPEQITAANRAKYEAIVAASKAEAQRQSF